MRQLVLSAVPVRRPCLQSAKEAVFGPEMLRRVHGPSLRFQTGEDTAHGRVFGFDVDVGDVPAPIRVFFCGKSLRVTTTQAVTETPSKIEVTNGLKLHFVGSELFKLRPSFWLERSPDGTVVLGGQVGHVAVLPPPLRGIAESFMLQNSERTLAHFGRCLAEAGVIDRQDKSGVGS